MGGLGHLYHVESYRGAVFAVQSSCLVHGALAWNLARAPRPNPRVEPDEYIGRGLIAASRFGSGYQPFDDGPIGEPPNEGTSGRKRK